MILNVNSPNLSFGNIQDSVGNIFVNIITQYHNVVFHDLQNRIHFIV